MKKWKKKSKLFTFKFEKKKISIQSAVFVRNSISVRWHAKNQSAANQKLHPSNDASIRLCLHMENNIVPFYWPHSKYSSNKCTYPPHLKQICNASTNRLPSFDSNWCDEVRMCQTFRLVCEWIVVRKLINNCGYLFTNTICMSEGIANKRTN